MRNGLAACLLKSVSKAYDWILLISDAKTTYNNCRLFHIIYSGSGTEYEAA